MLVYTTQLSSLESLDMCRRTAQLNQLTVGLREPQHVLNSRDGDPVEA